ncbi:MAG TPA: hypothetical protein VK797_21840 [Tepidisphaeraceae bacterium]|jgi:hypothetical protein|nr:hypothetical protein [Tepidisphaeraceae bacterium]
MIYHWESPVGAFAIWLDHDKGKWALSTRDGTLGHYEHPAQAADHVRERSTGFTLWDEYDRNFAAPIDLSGWEADNDPEPSR